MREPRRRWTVSPTIYWTLRRTSPLILLVAMAASGWLIVRAILVWGVSDPAYVYDVDIPIAAAVVASCALAVVALQLSPPSALARPGVPLTSRRAVIEGFGSEWRIWFLVSTPLCGLLGAFAPFLIPTALGLAPGVEANLWLGLPLATVLTIGSIAAIWAVARSTLHGVELTASHLIARGYFLSRRFARAEIVDVRIARVSRWAATLFTLARMPSATRALEIILGDGSRHVLNAATSSRRRMEYGVETIRSWLGSDARDPI